MPPVVVASGLTSEQARARLAEVGPNEVARDKPVSAWAILASQFKTPVVWLLAGATAVSAALGQVLDASAIGAILLLNALVGFFQEHRAERAVLALRAMTSPRARVVRDGRTATIAAAGVVPGDVLVLEAGDVVAADAKLVEAHELLTNEAVLTGESAPVEKGTGPEVAEAPLAERRASVFMGTSVAAGTGRAVVTATDGSSELGKIAHLLAAVADETTPLQASLARVSRVLIYLCAGVVALVALLGLLRELPLIEVFLAAVSLAVAAVPEGLPAIVTIALALGVRRLAARNVLVRKLASVETLGCTTVICTDKTGTLTTGVMSVRELWGADHARLLDAATACCDAELDASELNGTGDPTELAILVAAAERGIRRGDIEAARPRTLVHPFDSDRKRMSIRRTDAVLYVKGALETVLPLCSSGAAGALAQGESMAQAGLRVLAVAVGRSDEERDLELIGLIGMADPPRTEAIEAVAAARAAGVRTVMITGDHPRTAKAIAHELGIVHRGEAAEDLVHARATPEDKLRIVRDWKRRGAIVAMTGDGVNDAPALREAHIGIAMGKTGTEVTREASDMILTDDNFASIVAAVREGRGIFENIRKTLVYLLAGNASELLVMLGAALFGLPLPLLPLHLLWINLVTDGLPALGLVMDPPDPDAMKRRPRDPRAPLLGRGEWTAIALIGVLEAGLVLGVFAWVLDAHDLAYARGFAFSALVFAELWRSFAMRSGTRLFWEVGPFTNLRLLAIVSVSAALQLAIHHTEPTREIFGIEALSLHDAALAIALGLVPVSAIELSKLAVRALASLRRGRAR